jgi:signal transduction histidine kinase
LVKSDRLLGRVKAPAVQPSLALVTALMVLTIAVLAGGSLWALRRTHGQLVHSQAAGRVLDQGTRLTRQFANLPVVRRARDQADWQALSPLVQAMHAAENGLQYVSVSCEGVTVFHRQTSELDPAGPPLPDGIPPAEEVRMTRRVLQVGTQAMPVVVFAVRVPGEDGRPRVLEVALRKETVEREESAPTAVVASMFRVSLATVTVSFLACAVLVVWMMRREHRREERRRAEEHLAFAGVLANGIVHDFRNPMSSLRLDAQMLEKEAARAPAARPERIGELAGRMRATLDRMDKVFQEFLSVSRPAAVAPETFDLCACLRECAAMLAPRFEHKQLRIEFRGPQEGLAVHARRAPVQRALLNLLINAEHFSPQGGLVTVSVERAGHAALAEITDEGPGIPEADRERVFEMFHSGRPGGTGLGLFLARTAVENSGGTIVAAEAPGGGACLRVTLPLAKA